MSDTQQHQRNPVTFFVMGAMISPSFILLTSYILWLMTLNLTGVYWFATCLTGILTSFATFRMIASHWAAWRVSLFTAAASTMMGVCFAGASVLGKDLSMVGAMGLLFVTMLVVLFTDLDDHIKLPLIVLGMMVESSAVWIFFRWLAQSAQS